MYVEFYRDVAGDWRWVLRSHNHRVVADSAEGYATRGGAVRAFRRIEQEFADGISRMARKKRSNV